MEITQLSLELEPAYEAFLTRQAHALLYYSLPYKRFLEELLGCGSRYWVAVEDGRILGVLPVMEKVGHYGPVWNSLPFYGSNGGILAETPEAEQVLYQHYRHLLQTEAPAAATMVGNPLAPPQIPTADYEFLDERIGQWTSLETSPEALLAKLDSSTRRNIKKADAAGMTVRSDPTALSFLETCHRDTMAAMGGNAKSPAFFTVFPKHFQADRDYRIYVAEMDGQPIAALLLFYFQKTVEYFIPATLPESRTVQPMALILIQAMREAVELGYTHWNWGGTWLTQEGVYRFKKKWGAEDKPYRYYTTVNNRQLLDLTPAQLLQAYENFYVLPFQALGQSAKAAVGA